MLIRINIGRGIVFNMNLNSFFMVISQRLGEDYFLESTILYSSTTIYLVVSQRFTEVSQRFAEDNLLESINFLYFTMKIHLVVSQRFAEDYFLESIILLILSFKILL